MDKVVQHFQKGEIVIPEGSQGDRIYRIISGYVLICKNSPQGKMLPIAKLSAGEIFGEMYMFAVRCLSLKQQLVIILGFG